MLLCFVAPQSQRGLKQFESSRMVNVLLGSRQRRKGFWHRKAKGSPEVAFVLYIEGYVEEQVSACSLSNRMLIRFTNHSRTVWAIRPNYSLPSSVLDTWKLPSQCQYQLQANVVLLLEQGWWCLWGRNKFWTLSWFLLSCSKSWEMQVQHLAKMCHLFCSIDCSHTGRLLSSHAELQP